MTRMSKVFRGVGSGLVMLGVVAVAGLAGCGGSPPPPTCQLDSFITTTWSLEENGAPVECLPGDVVSLRVDNNSMIADFDCSAHAGTTPAIEGGVTHSVSFQLTDASGKVLSQTGEMALFVPCGAAQATPAVVFPVTP
jgi:hypothetical protein